jgi:hypothetical protein
VRLTGRSIVRVDETLFLSISTLSSKMRVIFHVNFVDLDRLAFRILTRRMLMAPQASPKIEAPITTPEV